MTTTTAVHSAWAIVDQIIRVEIPDAVPDLAGLTKYLLVAPHVAWLRMPSLISLIRESSPELAEQVMEMICDAGFFDGHHEAAGIAGEHADKIRKTLAEIKGAN